MENSQQKKIYRLADIAGEVDRDKTTLLRWEADGKIPPGRRDNRGWRYYTPEDFELVVRIIKSHLYSPNQANDRERQTANITADVSAATPITASFRETSSSGWFRRLFSLLFTLLAMVAIPWFSAWALNPIPPEVEKQITAVINTFRLPEASLSFSSVSPPLPPPRPSHSSRSRLTTKAEKKSRPSKVKPNEQRKASSSRKSSALERRLSNPPSLILPKESQIDFNPQLTLVHLQNILGVNLPELTRLVELTIDLEPLAEFFETKESNLPPPITVTSLKEKLRRGADSLPQTASLLDQAKGLWANVSRTLQLDLLGELRQETRPEADNGVRYPFPFSKIRF